MKLYLRTFGDPVLQAICKEVKPGDDLSYLREMRRICGSFNGIGLAAPQVGIAQRVVFLWPGRVGYGEFMLNPRVVDASAEIVTGEEGCLSYPGIHTPVERHSWVKVVYQSKDFVAACKVLGGLDAIVAQHEIDHTYGICRVGDVWAAGNTVAV